MKVAPAWRQWMHSALALLYPPLCAGCQQTLEGKSRPGWFCRTCREHFVRVRPPYCEICCEPFPGEITMDFTCPNCAGRDCGFSFAHSMVLSRGPVRDAIHRFKYGRDITLRGPLARLMNGAFLHPRLRGVPWVLVPVPLHPVKEREREFNQSVELARSLSRLTGLPWCAALRRTRKTDSQAGLSREDRLVNLKGAFALRRAVPGRDVLLIDDVLTTGTTAGECARVLLRYGRARRVAVLTVARA